MHRPARGPSITIPCIYILDAILCTWIMHAVSKIQISHFTSSFSCTRARPPRRAARSASGKNREMFERSSQARFGGLTLVSRAPWLLVTGAPGLFSWPNTLWNTAVACRMSPTSRTGQAAASRRHRHRNAEARPARGRGPPTQAWMLHDWLTVDLNEMLPAADLNIIISETE